MYSDINTKRRIETYLYIYIYICYFLLSIIFVSYSSAKIIFLCEMRKWLWSKFLPQKTEFFCGFTELIFSILITYFFSPIYSLCSSVQVHQGNTGEFYACHKSFLVQAKLVDFEKQEPST